MTIDYSEWAFDDGRWTKFAMVDYSSLPELDSEEPDAFDGHSERPSDDEPQWVIDVLADGTFSVCESHHSLTDRTEPFASLVEAVQFCDAIDEEIQAGRCPKTKTKHTAPSKPESPAEELDQLRQNQRQLPFS
jgi:hypothetical protein